MPSLPAVFVELRATTEQFRAQMGEARTTVENFSKSSTTGMQRLESVGKVAFIGLAGAATAFGGIAVKAALEGEQAHAQLVQAVQNSGTAFASVGGQVDDMSGRFAKLGYENDQVEQALARLVQSTGDVSGSMREMGLVADFARGRHVDLETAATIVGKVMNGNVTALKRVGIATTDASGATLTAAQALQMLSDRFGGAAQANADTYAGKLQAMNAEWHNMTEAVGNMLLPVLADMASVVANVVGWFDHHREVAFALAGVFAGPLAAAMTVYIAKQAIAFGENVAGMIGNVARAIFGIVPAVEAAEAAEAGLATTTALATGGLSILGAGLGLLAAHFLGHASATKEVGSSAEGASSSISGLASSEGDLGEETDGTTSSLKAQSELFKKLSDDTSAQQDEILKLISDQSSLDEANRKLHESTGANSQATQQAAQHARDLKSANDALAKANDDVTSALDRQTKAKKALDDLMKPQTQRNVTDAVDAHEQANDRLARANIDVKDKTTALTTAIAGYGAGSQQATIAQLDLNDALRAQHSAMDDVDDSMQALADTQRPMIGTTDQLKDANHELDLANKDVTDSQNKQKDAQTKLNEVLANSGAIKAVRDDTKTLADNTTAWLRATKDLNGDWGVLDKTLAANPGLRDQLVTQIKAMKDNLPKGADVSGLNSVLDHLTLWGQTLSKAAPPGSMLDAMLKGAPLFGNVPVAGAPAPPGPSLNEILTSGLSVGGAAEGAVVQATHGGKLMLVGEGGQDEAIVPLDRYGALQLPGAGGGSGPVGPVTIIIQGTGFDEETLANKVRDKLLLIGTRNGGVGLG